MIPRSGLSDFNKEKSIKEYRKHLNKLYESTKKDMNLTQIEFQELMGKIEVLGELLLKDEQ